MIELAQIQDNRKEVVEALLKRSVDYSKEIEEIYQLDIDRRKGQQTLDDVLARQNVLNKEIGILYKNGEREKAEQLKSESAQLKEESHQLKETQKSLEMDITRKLSHIPNPPHNTVKKGLGDADNEVIYEKGDVPVLYDGAKPHWELAHEYNLINFDLGSKITGAGFPVYIGKGAKLQRALINYFLDKAMEAGYTEVIPPLLVNEDSGFGTGQLPDKDGQMYHAVEDNLFLIPTAEVPITNIFRDSIVKETELPQKYVGYTPCFRREAGSYGKDVRGLNRLHQFDKVEIVQVDHPDRSYETLGKMIKHVEGLIESLGLPYRALDLCGGDLGTASAKTIDLEVYSAAQKKWLEVSSISNFETYQANRLKLRFKNADGKMQHCHTLNGSALALPRILASILENNQTKEGIKIPSVLVHYTGFEMIRK